MVREGTDGYLVPRGDDAACAKALMKVLDDPTKAAAMGAYARRRVEDHYALDRTIGRYYDLYRQLA